MRHWCQSMVLLNYFKMQTRWWSLITASLIQLKIAVANAYKTWQQHKSLRSFSKQTSSSDNFSHEFCWKLLWVLGFEGFQKTCLFCLLLLCGIGEAVCSFLWGYQGSKNKNRANFKNPRYFQITKTDLCAPILCSDKTQRSFCAVISKGADVSSLVEHQALFCG